MWTTHISTNAEFEAALKSIAVPDATIRRERRADAAREALGPDLDSPMCRLREDEEWREMFGQAYDKPL